MKTETHDEFVNEATRTMMLGHADPSGYFDDLVQRIEIAAIREHEAGRKLTLPTDDEICAILEAAAVLNTETGAHWLTVSDAYDCVKEIVKAKQVEL